MKKAIIYCRANGDIQKLQNQVSELEKQAINQGYVISMLTCDYDVKMNERALDKVKGLIEKGEVDALFIFDITRISRDTVENARFLKFIEKHNVLLYNRYGENIKNALPEKIQGSMEIIREEIRRFEENQEYECEL